MSLLLHRPLGHRAIGSGERFGDTDIGNGEGFGFRTDTLSPQELKGNVFKPKITARFFWGKGNGPWCSKNEKGILPALYTGRPLFCCFFTEHPPGALF